jgi:TonB family protein
MRSLLVVLVLATVAGCGPHSDPGAPVPTNGAFPGIDGRRCEYLTRPAPPRSLEEITRPGTRGGLLLRAREASPADSVELSVRYSHDGRLDWVRPVRANVDGARLAHIGNLISAAIQDTGPADWGFRLRFVGGTLDAILPAVVCPAQPTGRLPRVMPPTGTNREMYEVRQARRASSTISVLVYLDSTGRVTDVRLPHTTGSRLLDAYALDLARSSTHAPRLHDGMGVASQTTVTFRLPRIGGHQ